MLKKLIINFTKNHVKKILIISFSIFLTASIPLLVPLINKILLDTVLPGREIELLLTILIMFLILIIGNIYFNFLKQKNIHILSDKLQYEIQLHLIDNFKEKGLHFYNSYSRSLIHSHFYSDINNLKTIFKNLFPIGIQISFQFIGAILLVLWLSWQFVFIMLACVPFIIYFTKRVKGKIERMSFIYQSKSANNQEYINTFIDDYENIRMLNGHSHFTGILNPKLKSLLKYSKINGILNGASTSLNLMSYWVTFFCVLSLSSFLLLYGNLSIGSFVAINTYFGMLISPVMASMDIYYNWSMLKGSIKRIEEFYYNGQEETKKTLVDSVQSFSSQTLTLKTLDNRHTILDHYGFKLKEGDILSIAGGNGAGKTTLLKTLSGINKNFEGKIVLNDVYEISDYEISQSISYLNQNISLFKGTISDNITSFGLYNDDELLNVLINDTKLLHFVNHLDEGLQYKIDFNNSNLSGGQKQRIALARTLMKDAEIIIMDEPTASLDSDSVNSFLELLKYLKSKGKIIILSTHDTQISEYANKKINL
ncbi:ATP-binding cassette domain-containing protein [Halobacillus amylolyticus]|uniref:ABC transporter ATP-binding protein/permease n=1 Tax=Halobacillus amylolyticus TaxID=2932259 RepID=A0ABY4HH20_9BACI|nr:ABC transporter ATP-binding protein [Halobacillus amylolyticus]UOR14183.1 ABC transporter ATP-binding protein/permease [Halobacillus amylolyticus]